MIPKVCFFKVKQKPTGVQSHGSKLFKQIPPPQGNVSGYCFTKCITKHSDLDCLGAFLCWLLIVCLVICLLSYMSVTQSVQ